MELGGVGSAEFCVGRRILVRVGELVWLCRLLCLNDFYKDFAGKFTREFSREKL